MTTRQYEDFTLTDGTYELKSGTIVQIWTQSDGQWACAAYDHGPFCRRCHHISEAKPGKVPHLEAAMVAVAIDGQLDLKDHDRKGWQFHVTDAGAVAVEKIMARGGRTTEDLAAMSEDELRDFVFGGPRA